MAALAGAASPRSARAEELPSQAQVRVVRIQVDGDGAAVARTRVAAGELFERLGVASLVGSALDPEAQSAPGRARQVLATAYFDLRDPSSPGIVVVDAQTEREIVRRTFPGSASLEISVEELTHVLYAVVEAMLQTQQAAPEVAPAPPPAEEAPPPERAPPLPTETDAPPRRPRASGPTLALGAFARVLALDSSSIVPGGGLALAASSRGEGLAWGGTLLAALHASSEIGFEEARGGVRPFSLRAYGTASVPTASAVTLIAGFGGGIDVLRVETDLLPSDTHAEQSTVVDAILGSLLGARIPLGGSVMLDAALTLDLDLTPRRFVTEQGGDRAELLELGRLRPAFLLGGSYALASRSSSSSAGGRP